VRAAIITIGTELTDGRIVDTNTTFIAGKLERCGLRISLALSLPDDDNAIGQGLTYVLELEPSLLVIAGGLGPTQDDITAPAIARTLKLDLRPNSEAVAMVAAAMGSTENTLLPHQLKQAMLPAGARPLKPAGTAPGFIILHNGVPVVALPGVPWELEALWPDVMIAPEIKPILETESAPARRSLCLYETGESAISTAIASFLAGRDNGIEVSICSRHHEVVVELAYASEEETLAEALLDDLRKRFAEQVYSEGEAIETVTGVELTRRKKTLAIGESCTGGMLGQTITAMDGASKFFRGGVIAYDNEVKHALLKVRNDTLETVGAVSEAVAQQLAIGARSVCTSDYGIGITGIAGPTGGTAGKPVGLVYICVSSEPGDFVRGFQFKGGRDDVRQAAVIAALHMLYQKMKDEDSVVR